MEPYSQLGWFSRLVWHPFTFGREEPMVSLFSRLMWRNSKADVADEVGSSLPDTVFFLQHSKCTSSFFPPSPFPPLPFPSLLSLFLPSFPSSLLLLSPLSSFPSSLLLRSPLSFFSLQLQLPNQMEEIHWLNFSAIEAYFYRRQQQTCTADVTKVREKQKLA